MFEPRDIRPGHASAFDALAAADPALAGAVVFECSSTGALFEANAAYAELERAAMLAPGELAAMLVTALAPAGESVSASFTLELLGDPRHFHVRFVPVSTLARNELKFVGIMRESSTTVEQRERDSLAGWQGDELVRVNSDWYWETDSRGALISISRALELLVGQPAGALLGRPLTAIGTLLRGENGEVPYETAQARGSSFRDQLMSVTTQGGATRLYRLAGVAVPTKDGGCGYRGVAAVVPDSARLIERMRSELGRTAKANFLSSMSHELRTPLNAIIGFAEAMNHEVHGPLKAQYVEYAGDIANAGRHLLGLIQDLLDISSLDSGEIDLETEDFDLAALIEQARAMVQMKASARNIDIKAVVLDMPLRARGDRRRTLQILVNLLTNAVKFTPEGGFVGAEPAVALPGHVAVTVWDSGPGIDPEDHARVFQKFEQLPQPPYVASSEGTGLGLHISRRLAELMEGGLTLESRKGMGARFTLTLPAAD